MKTIEQEEFLELKVKVLSEDFIPFLTINQDGDNLCIDKKGAAELIKVLQEWVGNE